jgi:undecaprenyl diphosphate synthase
MEDMKLPRHIAIIMDGNGRWAKKRGRLRSYGHSVGADVLDHMCNTIADMGVRYLTVYAFSTENWKRAQEEVKFLMNLFRRYLKKVEKSAIKRRMRVRIIGDKTGLPEDIQEQIRHVESTTEHFERMDFQIALNYGGRDEIERAVTRLAEDVRAERIPKGRISGELIESYLDTAGIPDPDLMIRTSGETRISNFLLWQMAYTEFYFTDVAWPDFDEAELKKAIEYYNGRDRRFGDAK